MNAARETSCLVVVTYQYPFLPGEYFLETEIEEMVKYYSRVIVVPMRRGWSPTKLLCRGYPNSVEIVDLHVPVWPWVKALVSAVAASIRLVRQQRKAWCGRPHVPDSSAAAWLRSAVKVAMAKSALGRVAELAGPGAVFLSYWRLEAAAGLALLKADGQIEKVVVRAHGGDIYHSVRYPFESAIHQYANVVLTVSAHGAKFLTNDKGFPGEGIAIGRLGVRIPNDVSKPSTDGILRVVTCSNVIAGKRVDVIARFLGKLQCVVDWVHFGDGPEVAAVQAEILNWPAQSKARLAGRRPNAEVLRFYAENPVDVFVNLSDSEGVPVSIMEALAYGIPVIATAVGGTPEVVNADNGRVLPRDCTFEMFSEAVEALCDGDRRSEVRRAARRRAEDVCDASRVYPSTYALIRQMCEARVRADGLHPS